jgi:hypothetical protein
MQADDFGLIPFRPYDPKHAFLGFVRNHWSETVDPADSLSE